MAWKDNICPLEYKDLECLTTKNEKDDNGDAYSTSANGFLLHALCNLTVLTLGLAMSYLQYLLVFPLLINHYA